MKNAVIWDVAPCGSCKNRHFGGTHCLHHQGEKKRSQILFTLMIETVSSSETLVLTTAVRRHIPEGVILVSYNSVYRST
jgi:positive regulator of sigma E activity